MSIHFHTLRIKEVRKETSDCVSISFHIPPELATVFSFEHGQNITVRKIINGEELRRSYSICSSPFDDDFRVAVKRVEGGVFSELANSTLRAGDELDVLPPTG